jgi:hypothetical protein
MVGATVGISRCDGRVGFIKTRRLWHIAQSPLANRAVTVAPTIARIATVGELEAESWQNPPDLENQFLHQWMVYCTDLSFATGDF